MPIAKFNVGNIRVENDLILAPMDGYSDYPFRSICRRYGSALSYTAFVSAIDLLQGNQDAWHALTYSPQERPVVFQIFDDDEQRLLDAAVQIERLEPDIIDINMGCSVRRVSGRGAGAGLLRDPGKIGRIMARLSADLSVPVSAKIRLGWDNRELNYLEVVDAITENGGSLIAVHGRTRSQGYKGNANWDAIAEIKAHTVVPVIGNGDVRSLDDIKRFLKHTACDGIMIGRGAIGNPWIFSRHKRTNILPNEVRNIVFEHFDKMLAYHGEHQGMLRFRKHLKAYLGCYDISGEKLRSLLTCTDPDVLRTDIDALFKALPPGKENTHQDAMTNMAQRA
ncbi:MAG: tRNA-dihydrouridine synthase family protein [Anaerolineales bacterium]|jgi:nifR3 family TIM-barrel protein